MKALILVTLTSIGAIWTAAALGQERCTTDECLEHQSYQRADATMSIGEWLKASELPKSSPEHLKATLLAGSVLFRWEGKSHCKPQRADVDQAIAIAKRYFQEHPQIWHLDAPNGIGAALGNVWPCGAENGT